MEKVAQLCFANWTVTKDQKEAIKNSLSNAEAIIPLLQFQYKAKVPDFTLFCIIWTKTVGRHKCKQNKNSINIFLGKTFMTLQNE